MKKVILISMGIILFTSCGKDKSSEADFSKSDASTETTNETSGYDAQRGEGKFTSVELGATLDQSMVEVGQKISDVKCSACHKLSEEKLVGPGWKGVTERRKPEWIMNFITNPEPMIDKDPELQAQLELCLVRMPNQQITDDEARGVLEFMRKNDGVK